ncbi:MAG: GDSL-type esterase/lipase family protein, partial [Pseudomonadota bacterium]|nr:GDSL-type esterase/lipase family protein [Pseudomonadota bacterium]
MNKFISRSSQILLLLLALLVFPVATYAQNTDPTRWEETMQRFEQQDLLDPPPEGAILLTGSSSIARWNDQAAAALAPLTVIPRGFGGSVMGDVLYHLERVALKYKPRAILIYEGDNDTSYGMPENKILGQLKQIIAKIHDQLPTARIYVMSVKPSVLRQNVWSNAEKVNRGYEAIAKNDPLVYHIDSASPF